MDLINKVKDYFQKVVVVNDLKVSIKSSDDNPLPVVFPDQFINSGTYESLRVYNVNSPQWVFTRPQPNFFNVYVGSIYVQDVNTGFVTVVPLNQFYFNLSQSQVDNLEASFTTFNSLYPATSPAKVIYSKISSNGTINQFVVSIQ